MELANCTNCGRVFTRVGKKLCPDCLAREDELFKKVREFIEENPGHTVQEVADRCQVSPKKIYDFLKEGRLQRHNFDIGKTKWQCESCGSYITAGRICNTCQQALRAEIKAQGSWKLKKAPENISVSKGEIHLSRWRERKGP